LAAETIDTLVIGAGQSGLAMSHALAGSGRAHLVLERGRVGERWLSERWDSLAFQFPNWSVELPGLPYAKGPPEGFASGADIAGFIDDYARHISAPVRTGVTVRRLGATDGDFMALTSAGAFRARNVVAATGPYQRAAVPAAAADLAEKGDGVFQLHASAYRNPGQLPAGGVLVVGAGASGAQIAEDLVRGGRPVWLAVGSHRRAPRRYRGWDFHFWAFEIGEWDRPTAERVPGEPPPLLTGVGGGRDMDLRELAAMGVTLTGRLAGVEGGGVARFKPDLAQSLARGDAYLERFWDDVDAHVARTGLAVEPAERPPRRSDPASVTRPLAELDLAQAGVSTVLWASGYGLDLAWIDLPVVKADGGAIHDGGVSPVPGLYFLGLPWLTSRKSTVLSEVGLDAQRLAAHIAAR
jgi:putative flavoprotein involved in K+ transport